MKPRNEARPSMERLQECFSYDEETGVITWRRRPSSHFKTLSAQRRWNSVNAGKSAGSLKKGYLTINLDGQTLLSHRVAWAVHYGNHPAGILDHVDHDKTNNRLSNLRLVCATGNSRNLPANPRNTSGFVGVTRNKKIGKWQAQIVVAGRAIYLGVFDLKGDAAFARKVAEKKYGFHENHGAAR